MVQTQSGPTLNTLRTYNGIEYVNVIVISFLKEQGIILQNSLSKEHEPNGVPERLKYTIVTKMHKILQNFIKFHQEEAVATAVYI